MLTLIPVTTFNLHNQSALCARNKSVVVVVIVGVDVVSRECMMLHMMPNTLHSPHTLPITLCIQLECVCECGWCERNVSSLGREFWIYRWCVSVIVIRQLYISHLNGIAHAHSRIQCDADAVFVMSCWRQFRVRCNCQSVFELLSVRFFFILFSFRYPFIPCVTHGTKSHL